MRRKNQFYILSAFLLLPFMANSQHQELPLIPFPEEIVMEKGSFSEKDPVVTFSGLPSSENKLFITELKSFWPTLKLKGKAGSQKSILIQKIPLKKESVNGNYTLSITPKKIIISADNSDGIFNAIQTLKQITKFKDGNSLPALTIKDSPRFSYRGLHLDVSRHFRNVEFIKKQLDVIASYKLNRFHWHLTDGAGWRLQIKEYPLLTEVAAWRPASTWKEWWKGDRRYCRQDDPSAYGGFYTPDDIREVVNYAQSKHITVIPEIEMPGHSEEVLAVYPELSCSGEPYKNGELCIGNEATFQFLETVLDEVLTLFPSKYIHIGGDEANKEAWKKCPKCEQRMKKEGLKNEDELQSYLVHRIERYLNSKGRELLGWDEILDGGLSPNATVMSWRGENGGIQAVRMGHDAIMTPGEYCYFDTYQDNPSREPEAIGGYLPIKKVYSYNPVPDSLSKEEGKRILGVQANTWAEYMPTDKHAEYMFYPRLLALSEVAWTEPENKSWERFRVSVNKHLPWLKERGINSHPIANGVNLSQVVNSQKQVVEISFDCDRIPSEIRYTLDGSKPSSLSELFRAPISVKDSAIINVAIFSGDKQLTESQKYEVYYNKALGAEVTYNLPYSKHYKANYEKTLTDGCTGGNSYADGRWQGFSGDIDCTIDLGKITDIRTIEANFMQQPGPWIWYPEWTEIWISNDGKEYTLLNRIENGISRDTEGMSIQDFGYKGHIQTRYIRYKAHQLPKDGAYMFIDEISIR